MGDENGEAPQGQLTVPKGREVDAVEALEIGLYGVAVLAE